MKKIVVSILTVVIMLTVGVKILKADSPDMYTPENETKYSYVTSKEGVNNYINSGCFHVDSDNNVICDGCGICQNNVSTSNNGNNCDICGKSNCNHKHNSCHYSDSNSDGICDNRHSHHRQHNRHH